MVTPDTALRGVGMARVAGPIARHKIVLEMARRNVARIVYVEAPAIVCHYVAGEAELSALSPLHVLGKSTRDGQDRKNTQRNEGQHLASAGAFQLCP